MSSAPKGARILMISELINLGLPINTVLCILTERLSTVSEKF